jgi:hypothetical protein
MAQKHHESSIFSYVVSKEVSIHFVALLGRF